MATIKDTPPEVLNLHKDMIKDLGGLFSVKDNPWRNICNRIGMIGLLTIAELGDVTNMEDLFISLMRKHKINYGEYSAIRGILEDEDVDAARTIDVYTKRIQKAYNKQGKHKHSSDSGSEADGIEPKRRKENAGQLRKLSDDTHDARIINAWQRAMNAVGFIKGPCFAGTGFRVGKDKIMTAYHVAEDITKKNKDAEPDLSNLKEDDVSITFNFLEENKSDNHQKCYFHDKIHGDKELDFAILQLRNGNNTEEASYPNAIMHFKRACDDGNFTLLGHPDKKHMQLDPKVHIFDHTSEEGKKRLAKMKEWGVKKGYASAYEHIVDTKKNKVLFDCWVQHGASGSPGIEMDSHGEPVCSVMLTRGFPYFVFGEKYESNEEDHPYMIEQGVRMEAIAKKLGRMGSEAKEVKSEIFGDSFI